MKTKQISPKLIQEIKNLEQKGVLPADIKKYISKKTGFKKTKSREIYKDIVGYAQLSAPPLDDISFSNELDAPDKGFYYNPETKQYIVYLSCLGRNIVVSEEKYKNILQMYSNFDENERSVEQICRAIKWPRNVLTEFLRRAGITHDSLPFTEEDISSQSDEELVGRLKELKKFSLYQKFEKESWDDIRNEARNWREFKFRHLDPFKSFLQTWNPPKLDKLTINKIKPVGDDVFLIGCSDWHCGGFQNPIYSNRKQSWGKKEVTEFVDKYISGIHEAISNRKNKISRIAIMWLGDILDGLRGKTEKGTILEQSCVRDEQFNLAFDLSYKFISSIIALGYPVDIYSVRGNHDSVDNYTLFFALSKCFQDVKNIQFINYNSRYGLFKYKNSGFIIDHGAHDVLEAKIPRAPGSKNAYLQNLWLSHKDDISDCDYLYFIQGDLHHREKMEYNEYDFILLGSPSRSAYAENNNWNSRPSQSCFTLSDKGIIETIDFFFD